MIKSLNKPDAVMMIYLEGLNKFIDLFGEFEASLEVLPWKEIDYLEECGPTLKAITSDETALKSFFNTGISNLFNSLQYEHLKTINDTEAFEEVLNLAKADAIKEFNYDRFSIPPKEPNSSLIKRNKAWTKNMLEYIKNKKGKENIFIVCGANHLLGYIKNGCNSFIELLWLDTSIFSIDIIDNQGQWAQLAKK